ncbi:TrkA C-terminal domain-containing protein [Halospeciosus flavus]|uniref:TrkA C-terminal domain-containing protein n=1 Tax=Halospeciosus flavus TaxID=3032283 RepID=A0ABD5Z8V7_9EURY|nr:TrkA C-terminal domain-containing protein [Halospeciosus flavus]
MRFQLDPGQLVATGSEIVRIVSLVLLAFLVAAVVALVYRWYFRDRISTGLSVLTGVSAVALALNTKSLFGLAMTGTPGIFELEQVLFNSIALAVAGAAGPVGARLGDRAAVEVFAFAGAREIEGEVSQLVQAVGRVVAVELPSEVEDIETYDPVSDETKAEVAGKTLLFPRRLTVDELRDRLANRLKDDYDIGYVDVDLEPDGTVTYLGLGRRVAGLGPTLAPGTGAVATRADPPNAASPGDLVQVWKAGDADGERERVATAELRGVADDVVTLALDETDAKRIAGGDYKLLTLPGEPSVDKQFASLLRAADETMAAVSIAAESALVGETVADLDVTVVAVRPSEGSVVPIPARSREFVPGDTVYVIARPEAIRRVEERAGASAAGESAGEVATGEAADSPDSGTS